MSGPHLSFQPVLNVPGDLVPVFAHQVPPLPHVHLLLHAPVLCLCLLAPHSQGTTQQTVAMTLTPNYIQENEETLWTKENKKELILFFIFRFYLLSKNL